VEIKTTQGDRVALRDDCDLLLVLKLDGDGSFREVYNGPGRPVWAAAGKMQKNGQRAIGLIRLEDMNKDVGSLDRVAT